MPVIISCEMVSMNFSVSSTAGSYTPKPPVTNSRKQSFTMNRSFSLCLFAVASLLGSISLQAADVRSYHLVLPDGSSIPTTIIWKNIKGLDTLRGDFHYAAGDLGFDGKNSSSGFIWMNDENGTYYEFRKESSGITFRWVGSNSAGESLVLAPKDGSAPSKPTTGKKGTVRHYTYITEGGGVTFPVTIVWDDIQGLAGLSGTMTYPNGEQVSFQGRNPESGHIVFTDSTGATYELWRRKRGDSFEWSGSGYDQAAPFKVTLVPSNRGGNGGSKPAPPATDGTVRQYTMTGPFGEKYPATIIWSNIKGLGPIKGSLFSPGENLTIVGQNSRSGFIYFSDQHGTHYELTKEDPVNGKVRWSGTARFNDGNSRPVGLIGQ